MKEIGIRSLTGTALVLVVLGAMLSGPHSFFLLIFLVYALGSHELIQMEKTEAGKALKLNTAAGGIFLLVIYFSLNFGLPLYLLALPALVLIVSIIFLPPEQSSQRGFIWLAVPLAAWYGLGWWNPGAEWGWEFPLFLIVLIWINDTFAYLTGSLLGRHRIAPALSPGKTWEGFAGGLVFSMLATWPLSALIDPSGTVNWLVLAPLISTSALLGDLAESRLKRKHGLKDSGTIMPGHGGMLDRFDSLFFAAPALLISLIFISLLP